jgi:hypothetical protein
MSGFPIISLKADRPETARFAPIQVIAGSVSASRKRTVAHRSKSCPCNHAVVRSDIPFYAYIIFIVVARRPQLTICIDRHNVPALAGPSDDAAHFSERVVANPDRPENGSECGFCRTPHQELTRPLSSAERTWKVTDCTRAHDPTYGPAVRRKRSSSRWCERSCINVSGLGLELVGSGPSWISARVRSL